MDRTSQQDTLEAFRRRTGRRKLGGDQLAKLPRRELLLLCALALPLVIAPWQFGSILMQGIVVLNVTSLLAFAMLFVPLGKSVLGKGVPDAPGRQLERLLRFPVFWIGLFFMVYVAIQGLNSHYIFEGQRFYVFSDGPYPWWRTDFWSLRAFAHIPWLPAGVDALMEMNSWRMLLVWLPPWLLACTIWTGLRTRRGIIALMVILAINAVLLGAVGMAQELTEAKEIFWRYNPGRAYSFFASFFYPNHAGSYLLLGLGLAMGMYLYFFDRGKEKMGKSGPEWLFLMGAMLIAASLFFSDVRAAMVLGVVLLGLAIVFQVVLIVRHRAAGASFVPVVLVLIAAAGLSAFVYKELDQEKLFKQFELLEQDISKFEEGYRYNLLLATQEMIRDEPLWGWGAGSFRYVLPEPGLDYQGQYPLLHRGQFWYNKSKPFFRYAHCDWLQYPMELGIVGCGLILLMAAYFLGRAVCLWRYLRWSWVIIWMGLGAILTQALFDFPLYNPAVLMLFAFCVVAPLRMMEIEQRRSLPSA